MFVWVTAPSSPGLSTRIETLTLLGSDWVAVAAASAETAGSAVAACALDSTEFVCTTSPESPWLATRTETATFAAPDRTKLYQEADRLLREDDSADSQLTFSDEQQAGRASVTRTA